MDGGWLMIDAVCDNQTFLFKKIQLVKMAGCFGERRVGGLGREVR